MTFELDDGQMKAHRSILVARCDVMRAMLNGDFREAHSSVVSILITPIIQIKNIKFSDIVSWRYNLHIP